MAIHSDTSVGVVTYRASIPTLDTAPRYTPSMAFASGPRYIWRFTAWFLAVKTRIPCQHLGRHNQLASVHFPGMVLTLRSSSDAETMDGTNNIWRSNVVLEQCSSCVLWSAIPSGMEFLKVTRERDPVAVLRRLAWLSFRQRQQNVSAPLYHVSWGRHLHLCLCSAIPLDSHATANTVVATFCEPRIYVSGYSPEPCTENIARGCDKPWVLSIEGMGKGKVERASYRCSHPSGNAPPCVCVFHFVLSRMNHRCIWV